MSTRAASHAGTWYSSQRDDLDQALFQWLKTAAETTTNDTNVPSVARNPMGQGCKAVIAPHAGYTFSGSSAAWAYGCIRPDDIDRVFVLGPSHVTYLQGCALSPFKKFATPLGDLHVDEGAVQQLRSTKMFAMMSEEVDEAEHSIEMHLPYIYKVWGERDVKIVPVLVGHLPEQMSFAYALCFAQYFADPRTLFVISSDFCHWGSRFQYTWYQPTSTSKGIMLSSANKSCIEPKMPIYQSIQNLDAEGMSAISFNKHGSRRARQAFAMHLTKTGNTICGRNPILLMLTILEILEDRGAMFECRFTHYKQSNACCHVQDSSVSYATAYVRSSTQ